MTGRRILLFGCTGRLGAALAEVLGPGHDLTGVGSADVDVRDAAAVEGLVDATAPEIIVNAAARIGIDACENDPTATALINGLFPGRLARLAAAHSAELIHFSTDAVFSGNRRTVLTEDDAPDPINAYGASKLLGEMAVREATERAHIFRLSVLFGPDWNGDQFVERMVARARAGTEPLRIADDVVMTPTFTPDVAAFVRTVIENGLAHGLHHLAGGEAASLFDLVRHAVEISGIKTEVKRASHRDFPSTGRKNLFTPLRSTHLPPLRSWPEAMAEWCGGR